VAEHIASEYIRLRYRLLPTLYAAARRTYEDGTPIMRRCDLEWPNEPQAKRDLQFLFGEDLLIAPIALGKTKDIPLPIQVLQTQDGRPGLQGEYFDNQDLRGAPVLARVDSIVNFFWSSKRPDPRIPENHFSVRWTGKITLMKEAGKLKIVSDDGVRVWIDDSLVVDAWHDQPATDYPIGENLEPGHSYPIRIEYFQNAGGAQLQLLQTVDVEQEYRVWIPPGNWQDIWRGEILQGPKTIVLDPVLWKCPIYVRNGGIVLSLPQMQYTTEHPWGKVIVDAFVPLESTSSTTRTLYEDDGLSPAYQKDAFSKTPVTLARNGETIRFVINKRTGNYPGAISSRDWVVRLNLPKNSTPKDIIVNGKEVGFGSPVALLTQTEEREEAMPFSGPGSRPRVIAGPILELILHQQEVRDSVQISCTLK
jgi:hypothetical protein